MDSTATSHPLRVLIAYFCVYFLWGSTYLAIRIGVQAIPPAMLAGVRFLLSGLLLVSTARLRGQPFPSTRRDFSSLAMVGLFLLVGGNGLVVWSEQWVPSSLAAVIVATVPLFISSMDSFIPGGHRLSGFGWIGIVVGFAGVVVLVAPSLGLGGGQVISPMGIAGLVGAAVLWSVGSVYARRRPVKGDIFMNAGIEMLFGGIVLSAIAILTGEIPLAEFTTSGILSLLYLILFGSIIGFTSYGYLLRHVPPAKASTYAYVNPIVAVILGAAVLSEPVTVRTVAATAIVLAGVGIVQVASARSTEEKELRDA